MNDNPKNYSKDDTCPICGAALVWTDKPPFCSSCSKNADHFMPIELRDIAIQHGMNPDEVEHSFRMLYLDNQNQGL